VTIREFFRPLPFGAFVVLPAALAIVLLQPGTAESQPGRGGGFDPSRIFDMIAQGKDYLDMNDIQRMASRDPSAPERWQKYMQENGITNGRVTRDQFAGYMQARMAERGDSRGPGGPGGPSTPGGPQFNPQGGPQPMGGNQQSNQGDEERMRSKFSERDKNHDGVLSPDEMSDSLRGEVEKWDKNQNGVIEWEEYKEYYAARYRYNQDQQGGQPGWNGGPGDPNQQNGDERQRLVYRAGYLPKDLPGWFSQVKHTDPTQISLSEWLAANPNSQKGTVGVIEEFRKYDRNLDGFITIEEALVAERARTGRSIPLGGVVSGNGQPQPKEETMLVIAPLPEKPEQTAMGMMTNPGSSGKGGNSYGSRGMPGMSFGSGDSSKMRMPGGFDPKSMGNFDPSKMMRGPGGDTRSSGGDPRRGPGGPPSGDSKKGDSGRSSGGDSKGRGPGR